MKIVFEKLKKKKKKIMIKRNMKMKKDIILLLTQHNKQSHLHCIYKSTEGKFEIRERKYIF